MGRAHHADILAEATKLAEAGQLKPLLDAREFTLDTVEEAYGAIGTRSSQGKLVITVAGAPRL